MKRKSFAVLMIMIFAASALFASGLDRFSVGTGNDLWAYGMTRNDDDQLSFASYFQADFGRMVANLDFLGITNRGWKHGWNPKDNSTTYSEDVFEHGRYDMLDLSLGYRFSYLGKQSRFLFTPKAGISAFGWVGLEVFQQGLHRIAGIHAVDLPYETQTALVRPLASFEAEAGYSLKNFDNTSLMIVARATGNAVFGFEYVTNAGAGLALTKNERTIIGMGLSYNHMWVSDSWYTHNLYSEYLNSLQLNFTTDLDYLTLTYNGNLETGYGYGIVAIDFVRLIKGLENRNRDISFNIGYNAMYNEHVFSVKELEAHLTDNLSVFVRNEYIAGDALDAEAEKNADLSTEQRHKLNHLVVLIGSKYSFGTPFSIPVQPFASLSAGLYVADYDVLQNMIDSPSTLVPSYQLHQSVFMAVDLEAGVSVPLPAGLPISLYVSGGLMFDIGLKTYSDPRVCPNKVVNPHASIGFSTAIDL